MVAVVAGACVGRAKDVVGFGDGDEAGGCVRRGVEVGVVLLGESIELSNGG